MWGEKEPKKKETLFDGEQYTFLGKGVHFEGKAQFDGTVRVDGHFEGEITTSDTLIIGEHAVIKGTITGGIIVSGGKVEGDITAYKRIQLLKPAVVIGNIHAPSFCIEEGVLFHGHCDMGVSQDGDLDSQESVDNVHHLASHRDELRAQEM